MLLGARQFFERRGGGPTARDYVQDGLIAMWDGIENAGWGTHTDTGLSWVDLIGGHDAVDSYGLQRGTWLQDGFRFTASTGEGSTFYSDAVPMRGLRDWTCECCCCPSTDFRSLNRGIFGNMGSTSAYRGVCGFQYNGSTSWFGTYNNGDLLAIENSRYLDVGIRHTIALVSDSASGKYYVYYDGSKTHEAAGTKHDITFDGFAIGAAYVYRYGAYNGREDGVTRRFAGDIYCTRVFSRSLTAAEIAANYAIDKVRFNLT